MGSGRRSQPVTVHGTSQAPAQFGAQRHHKTRAILGQLRWRGGHDVQRHQQHNRTLPGKARFVQQCGSGRYKWNGVSQHKGTAAGFDLRQHCCIDRGFMGCKLLQHRTYVIGYEPLTSRQLTRKILFEG